MPLTLLTRLLAAIACTFALSGALSGPVIAQETYTIGIVPQFEPRKLAQKWTPILAELERRTGIRLEMTGPPDIPEFEVSFERGEFDFTYMNPYHFLVAQNAQGYVPLIRDGGRSLFGILAVRTDSPYQSVADLQGETIAFPAPNALGAALMMRAVLDAEHGIKFEPVYVSTHTAAYLTTVVGEAAATGGVMSTYKAQKPALKDNLRILFETRRVPPHPIAAHPRVPEEARQMIRQAILDMGATAEGLEMLSKIPMKQPIIASSEDYLVLEEMNLERYYVSPEG